MFNFFMNGLSIIEPKRFFDDRGFFEEVWSSNYFSSIGINDLFVQDNFSYSENKFTIRGLHAQAPPAAQSKLVRCNKGSIFDVVVDIRKKSMHYGKYFGIELSAENGKQLYIPSGFLHGFITLEPKTEISYKCSKPYYPSTEISVNYKDKDLAIKWPRSRKSFTVSEKDSLAKSFDELISPF